MTLLYKTDKRALAHFADCREYQRHLRKGGEIYDNVQIGNILYTQDEYDMDGKYITYGNKRTGMAIRIETQNRYSEYGTSDAEVRRWNSGCWRNDIIYID